MDIKWVNLSDYSALQCFSTAQGYTAEVLAAK